MIKQNYSNIVLTGGTGLLGSHLLPMLADKAHVWAIGQGSPEETENVSWVKCDLAGDLSCLREQLPERVDAVIHLAQSQFFRDFPAKADHIFHVNVASTQALLQIASERGCQHFVNASTGGVYDAADAPFIEGKAHVTGRGLAMYPASKLCSELLVNAYAGLFSVVNLRFFFIYGKGQSDSMLMPRLVNSVYQGAPITLQGENGLSLNPVHASDAAKAVIAALSLDGAHAINVAGRDIVTLRQIGEWIGSNLGVAPKFDCRAEQKAPNMVADIEQMSRHLLSPEIACHHGIADYCNHYLAGKAE
ncbi:NAD-dependent epimerase/dehydratase family protein [Mariprofundus erugo]|uniref:NAD-dependent epimerase/dehydratase family protein n=1 Tax=Mariprofundus erugo TaxID=2528639 RepID=UPI00137608C1|nr:NAD(P)-dependent oxidoreductase [Mariprofundus erugo]